MPGKIIDTHFHIWNQHELPMPWFEGFKEHFDEVVVIQDYLDAIKGLNIVASCYQEVDVEKNEAMSIEAEQAIQLCEDSSQIVAATIGGNLSSPDFKAYIEKFGQYDCVKSVRDNFFFSDPARMKEDIFVEHTKLLGQLGLMKDLVLAPEKIMTAVELVEKCPETRFVINHCGFMPAYCEDQALIDLWREGMKRYAQAGNTLCKISGLFLHISDRPDWKVEDLRWVVDYCLDQFGEDRVVFASNWPVCTLTGSLRQWVETLSELVKDRSEEFKEKLFYKNAERYYLT